jgi:hypothetical protein
MRTHTISNSDDVIDSRDVIARISELEDERNDLLLAIEDATEAEIDDKEQAVSDATCALEDWDEGEDGQELKMLKALAEEAEGCSDWRHGETLIRDSYFEQYAMELADDCCDMKKADSWPLTCIDWEKAADELKMDYTSIEFGDVTYWIRS